MRKSWDFQNCSSSSSITEGREELFKCYSECGVEGIVNGFIKSISGCGHEEQDNLDHQESPNILQNPGYAEISRP